MTVQAGTGERFKIGHPDFVKKTESILKTFFKNSKDHYSIDRDIKKIVNEKKEWVWEKEIKNRRIFIKFDGIVRFEFRFIRVEEEKFIFYFNGQRFVMNHELSYMNHKNRLLNLLNTRQGVLESLLVGKAYALNETGTEKSVEEKVKEAVNDPYKMFAPLVLGEIVAYTLDVSSFGVTWLIKYGFSKFFDATFSRLKKSTIDKQLQCIDSDNNRVRDYFLKALMIMEAGEQKKEKKRKHINITKRLSPCLGEGDELSRLLEEENFKIRFEKDMETALAVYYLQYCTKYGKRNHRSMRSEKKPVQVRNKDVKCVKTRKPDFITSDWKAILLRERGEMFNTCREVLNIKMKKYSSGWFDRRNETFNNCYARFHCVMAEKLNYKCTCHLPGYSCLIETKMRSNVRSSESDR